MAKCEECKYLDPKNCREASKRYYCKYHGWYVYANSGACRYFDKKLEQASNPSGCFLTTACVDVLNLPDEYLNILRYFRDEVMAKDEKYDYLLKEYDVVGPLLSEAIRNSQDKEFICKTMYETYIIPTKDAILKGQYDYAVSIYSFMVYNLKRRFNIPDESYMYEYKPDAVKGHGNSENLTRCLARRKKSN